LISVPTGRPMSRFSDKLQNNLKLSLALEYNTNVSPTLNNLN